MPGVRVAGGLAVFVALVVVFFLGFAFLTLPLVLLLLFAVLSASTVAVVRVVLDLLVV